MRRVHRAPACCSRALLALSLVFGASAAIAQAGTSYPGKPVRMLGSGVGGTADFVARTIAQGNSGPLGQQVIVDNRGGAGGLIPGEMLAKAPPDGHTVLVYGSTIWVAPLMREKNPYDALRDFAPITLAASAPTLLVVHPSLPVKNARELIALAKTKPGELNYGTSGIGSASHLAGELFASMAGIRIVRVNYKGAAPAFNDTAAGHVQMTFGTGALVMPHLKAGRLKALGVTSAQRSQIFPQLPTIAGSGLPGYSIEATFAMFAPARTPEAIVQRLNHEVVRFLRTPEAKQRLLNTGVEVVASSPEELTAVMKAEIGLMTKLIRTTGIREE
jgi:tripartite-type tricarboxylate transporter receptor subunit TctC